MTPLVSVALPTPRHRGSRFAVAALGLGVAVIASSSALAASAAPSSTGTIAFVTEIDGNDEIAIMSADGLRSSVVTNNAGPDRAPSWSADGSILVFNSRRAPHATLPQIYQLDPSTGATTRLTTSTSEDQRASLSADGTTLYFQRGVFFAQPYNLIGLELATGAETPLTTDVITAIWNAAPAPSPDGRWLLFQSNRDVPTPTGPFPQTLYALDLTTSTITALPPGDGLDATDSIDGPRWSADGTEFVYSSGGRLFVGTVSGTDPAAWTSAPITSVDDNSSPSFSPAGSSIVFQTYVEGVDPDGADDVYLIRVLERATGDIVTIGEGRTPVWTAREWLPAAGSGADPELAATGPVSLLPIVALGFGLVGGGLIVARAVVTRRRTTA
jgi:TolB protein